MLPTLLAAAGEPDIKEKLLEGGVQAIGRDYNVHLDGYDLGPALKGEGDWPRNEFLYWTDDGSVAALRWNDWKFTYLKQNALGYKVWTTPFEVLRAPSLTNLRMDPFERAEEENAMGYQRWWAERMFVFAPAGAYVASWLSSFQEFPPRQEPGSFNLDKVMEAMTAGSQGNQ